MANKRTVLFEWDTRFKRPLDIIDIYSSLEEARKKAAEYIAKPIVVMFLDEEMFAKRYTYLYNSYINEKKGL